MDRQGLTTELISNNGVPTKVYIIILKSNERASHRDLASTNLTRQNQTNKIGPHAQFQGRVLASSRWPALPPDLV